MGNTPASAVRKVRQLVQAALATQQASRKGTPGLEFAAFGRRAGWALARSGQLRAGLELAIHPVTSVRHFELAFARTALPPTAQRALDVSSPRLFSLFAATEDPTLAVAMLNPDADDVSATSRLIDALGLGGRVAVRAAGVDALADERERYDVAWSLSVVEHIAGAYDDRAAVAWMFAALRPGGRLILTVPVDRSHRDEFHARELYGTQPADPAGRGYFFQRWYDATSLHERLVAPLGVQPVSLRWFGERRPGAYDRYQERLRYEGFAARVDDAGVMARDFREFARWEDMPGMGVCGLVVDKPA